MVFCEKKIAFIDEKYYQNYFKKMAFLYQVFWSSGIRVTATTADIVLFGDVADNMVVYSNKHRDPRAVKHRAVSRVRNEQEPGALLTEYPSPDEPTTTLCGTLKEVLVLVMVASTSSRADLRVVVRETWGIFRPTFFVMGLNKGDRTRQTVTNRLEAATFDDLLVFDFLDHHLNQTLKTAVMLKWTMEQCPEAQFMFKTEDDVMVNPWTLNMVLEQYGNAQLIGYSLNDSHSLRSEHKERYIQKLLREDGSLQYLSGTGYLIGTGYIPMILMKAYQVPMINLEDVYFTYLVAQKELGLTLTHDRRLSPYKPWLQLSCVYWNQASIHRLSPREMITAWYFLEDLVIANKNVGGICKSFNKWFNAFSDMVIN